MHAGSGTRLASQCFICGAMLTGAISLFYRSFGIRRSPRNPNLCTRCGTHVEDGELVEITVVFADLSSFTELTHDLGAEKTHELVDAFLRMATDILTRHGAFIDKYVGDAVMALFNVPIRHENHARRAIVAALEIGRELEALGARFDRQLRASVGIASGYARVGRLGSDDAKDYTAVGDAVNLAARLQAKAGAQEILIAERSYAAYADEFPGARREQVALKGFRDPVIAYRLHGDDPAPLVDDEPERTSAQALSLGAIVFSILGAPCAVATLIGPAAVALGVGGLLGLGGALTFLDQSLIRIPVLLVVTLAAFANLYTVVRARRLKTASRAPGHLQPMTPLERRRTRIVVATSIAALAIVAFELVAHAVIH